MLTKNIKTACKANGITIQELEKLCGLGKNTIGRWDRVIPSLDKVIKVSNFLHVSLDDLCKRELTLNPTICEMENDLYKLSPEKLNLVKCYLEIIKGQQ